LEEVGQVSKEVSDSERIGEPSDESISNTKYAGEDSKDPESKPNVSTGLVPSVTHVHWATKGVPGFRQACDGTFSQAKDAEMVFSERSRTGRPQAVQKAFKPKQQIDGYLT